MRDEYIIYLGTSKPQAAFTAATTDIITSAAHGLSNGDLLQLTTATTLPAGLSLATNYYVIDAATDTFNLSASPNGPSVNITDTGTGTHTYHLKGRVIYVGDWKIAHLSLNFISTPTMTVKVQGAVTQDAPDFNAAQSSTNRWEYIDVTDTQNNTSIDGDTGIACTGTADNRILQVTQSGLRWLTIEMNAFTAGTVDARCRVFDERHE
jgi:hypothetical protein